MDGKTLDSLTSEDVQQLKAELWSPTEATTKALDLAAKPSVVAEGDSWFDYPPGLDILDHLRRFGYGIMSVAQHGDTLENMTYGSETTRNFDPKPPQLATTLSLIAKHQPKFFLFSGGGNDVAGAELESYLDHARSTTPGLRAAYVDYIFGTVVREQYEYLIDRVKRVKADIQIIIHGYANAIPDGRAVVDFPLGFHFFGPWLKPSIVAKGFMPFPDGRDFIAELVKRFNDTLNGVASRHSEVHYVDLRPIIADEDWANELHLCNSAYERVAKEFDRVMQGV